MNLIIPVILIFSLSFIGCNQDGSINKSIFKQYKSNYKEPVSDHSKAKNKTSYPFKGIVIKVFNDTQEMLIDHDEVPGFMMEMVMMFDIASHININQFEEGDSLHFDFHVLEQKEGPAKTWADNIRIISQRELTEDEEYDNFFEDNYTQLQKGEKFSDITLLDLNGRQVKLSDWDNKLKFVSFIFSRCPMPNYCPALIMKNQFLMNQFKENPNIEFIIISFDYNYDRPQVLNEIYGFIADEYNNVHFLSSYNHKDDLIKIAEESGLGFSGVDEHDARNILHTLQSLVISPDRKLINRYSGDSWDPKDVQKNIEYSLKKYGMN
tara:strand:+ start:295 stop:1260 length:966 start_codon:yes stop_codon:yes gene_type:complete